MSAAEEMLAQIIEKLNALVPPPKIENEFDTSTSPTEEKPIVINGTLLINFNGDVRTGHQIIAAVRFVTGTPALEFHKHNRWKSFCEARHIAYWFMRHFTTLSYPQIGRMIGGRDHSTVIYGVERVNKNFEYFRSRTEAVAKVLKVSLPHEVPFQ